MAGANSVGIKIVWITKFKTLPTEKGFKKPNKIIKSIPEVLKIVNNLND